MLLPLRRQFSSLKQLSLLWRRMRNHTTLQDQDQDQDHTNAWYSWWTFYPSRLWIGAAGPTSPHPLPELIHQLILKGWESSLTTHSQYVECSLRGTPRTCHILIPFTNTRTFSQCSWGLFYEQDVQGQSPNIDGDMLKLPQHTCAKCRWMESNFLCKCALPTFVTE
jgi:hypothetical protein